MASLNSTLSRGTLALHRESTPPADGDLGSTLKDLEATLEFGGVGTQAPLTKQSLANVFSAESGLLLSLRRDRVSGRIESKRDVAPPTRPELLIGLKPAPRQASEKEVAEGEVQSLATIPRLGISSTGGVGIEEMKLARKERQEQAIEVYNKRKSYLNVEIELRTGQAARSFKQLLALNDSEIESFFQELNDEFLTRLELHDVQTIGTAIDSQGPRRATWIAEFESELDEMEGERRQAAHIELCQLMDACVEIAHMLPSELERELEKMTSEVNVCILGNKKVHATLLAKLRVAEVRRQREHEQRFALRLAAWRAACHAHALSLFKEHMATAAVVAPEERKGVLHDLRAAQAAFSAERVALLRSLAELDETRLSRAAGAAKAAEAAELAARQGEMHASFVERLREADARTDAHVASAIAKLNDRLSYVGHLDAEGVAAVVAREAEPLAAERRAEAAALIERIGRALDGQLRRLHEGTLAVAAMFQQAGEQLDENQRRTDELFAGFKGRLHDARAQHERADRELEAQLDATVLAMRQEATEAGAAERLSAALALLLQIESGYVAFGEQTLGMLDAHPAGIEAEMARFSAAVLDSVEMMAEGSYEEWMQGRRERLAAAEAAARSAAAEQEAEAEAAAAAASAAEKGGKGAKGAKGAKGGKEAGKEEAAPKAASKAVAARAAVPKGAKGKAQAAAKAAEEAMQAAAEAEAKAAAQEAQAAENEEDEEDEEDPDESTRAVEPGTEARWGAEFPPSWRAERMLEAEARGEDHREAEDHTQWLRVQSASGSWFRLLRPEEAAQLRRDRETAAAEAAAAEAAAAAALDGAPAADVPPPTQTASELLEAASAAMRQYERLDAPADAIDSEQAQLAGLPAELAGVAAPLDTDGQPCITADSLDPELVHAVRRHLAACVASHIEKRTAQLVARARADADALRGSIREELDERLLAHRPRAGRLELDVRDQRLDQIQAHKERFGRHARYVMRRAAALREHFAAAMNSARESFDLFVREMGGRESELRHPKNTHVATMDRLKRDAEAAGAAFKRQVQEEQVEALRALSAASLEQLRALNGSFGASMVRWSEGGEYHEDEIALFSGRLAALDADAQRVFGEEQELIGALADELLRGVEEAEASFARSLELNRIDVALIAKAKAAHAAGAVVMRSEFTASQMAEDRIAELTRALAAAQAGASAPADAVDADARELCLREMLRVLDELRRLCLARARHLEILDSTIPAAELSTDIDGSGSLIVGEEEAAPEPAQKGGKKADGAKGGATAKPAAAKPAAKPAAAGKAATGKQAAGKGKGKEKEEPVPAVQPPGSDPDALIARIENARVKTEVQLLELYAAYYATKGERAPTRPAELAADQEEAGRRVTVLLAHFTEKATEHRRAKNRAFRTQLFELEALLPAVAASALDATRLIACARADADAARLRAAFERRRADLAKRRHVHEASLKPSLSNPNRRAELQALEEAEEHRLAAAKAAATELQAQLIGGETAHAAAFLGRLGRTTAVLTTVLDHFVFPPDLIPPEEPPEAKRKALRAKLTEELIELTSTDMPSPMAGRKFPLKAWRSLPVAELTPEAAGLADVLGAAAPAVESSDATATNGAVEDIQTFLTPAHRAAFASRDRSYAVMRTRYHDTAQHMFNECQVHLREEEAWSRNWAKMTGMLKGRG